MPKSTVRNAKIRFIASLTGGGGPTDWRVRDLHRGGRVLASGLPRHTARAYASALNASDDAEQSFAYPRSRG